MQKFAEEVRYLGEEPGDVEPALDMLTMVAEEDGEDESFAANAATIVCETLRGALPSRKAIYLRLVDHLMRGGGANVARLLTKQLPSVLPSIFAVISPAEQEEMTRLVHSWGAMSKEWASAIPNVLKAFETAGRGGVERAVVAPRVVEAAPVAAARPGGFDVVLALDQMWQSGHITSFVQVPSVLARLGADSVVVGEVGSVIGAMIQGSGVPSSHPDSRVSSVLAVLRKHARPAMSSMRLNAPEPNESELLQLDTRRVSSGDGGASRSLVVSRPFQSEDGHRFATETDKANHDRWLREEKERLSRRGVPARGWYPSSDDWIEGKDGAVLASTASFFDQQRKLEEERQNAQRTESPDLSDDADSDIPGVPVGSLPNRCAVCNDTFPRRLNEATGDIEYVGAVLIDGQLFHQRCLNPASP